MKVMDILITDFILFEHESLREKGKYMELIYKLFEPIISKIIEHFESKNDIVIKYIEEFQKDDGMYDLFFIDAYYTMVNDYKADHRIQLINNSDKTICDIYVINKNNNKKLKLKHMNIATNEVKPNSKVVIQIKPLENIEDCIVYFSINQGVSYLSKKIVNR